jgi:hypothetical protein
MFSLDVVLMSNDWPITGEKMHGYTTEMQPGSPAKTRDKVRFITIEHLDGRTGAARAVRELVASIESDLGGSDQLSAGQRQLVQRAGVLGAFIEDAEVRWASGQPINVAEYLAAINAQRRVLVTIGLERKARDAGSLSLAQFIESGTWTGREHENEQAAVSEAQEGQP